MEIDWRTATQSSWELFTWLRDAALAPPATKSAEHLAGSLGTQGLSRQTLLPMYKARGAGRTRLPGGALHSVSSWNDGHQSGIYSWDYLRLSLPLAASAHRSVKPRDLRFADLFLEMFFFLEERSRKP